MSLLAAQRPQQVERRRHARVPVSLFGRYMLHSRREFPCVTVDMSPGGVRICAPVQGVMGERIVVYLDQVGRIEGQITRLLPDGFAMTVGATLRKRDKVAAQLTWFANRKMLGLPEDRRHERIVPRNTRAVLRTSDGREIFVRIIDVSMSGAAIGVEGDFTAGMTLYLGSMPAKIVRKIEGGLALEFFRPLTDDEMTQDIEFN
jgi:hypothetical protein